MKSTISTLLILIFLGIGMTSSNAQTLDSFNLEDYKWKNRVLIVFSPNTYNPDYREQVKTVRSSTKGIQDRDLQIFYALDQSSAMAKEKSYLMMPPMLFAIPSIFRHPILPPFL